MEDTQAPAAPAQPGASPFPPMAPAAPPAAPVGIPAPVAPAVGFSLHAVNTTVASNAGADVELLHPGTKEPLGIFIRVLGKDSDIFRDHMKRRVDTERRKDAMAQRRGKQPEPQTTAEMEANTIEVLTLCTTGWHTEGRKHLGTSDHATAIPVKPGEPYVEFSETNAAHLYTNELWVRNQIDEAIVDIERFL